MFLEEMHKNDAKNILNHYLPKAQSDIKICQQIKFLSSLLAKKYV